MKRQAISNFIMSAIISNPGHRFFYDNSSGVGELCVEVKKGDNLDFYHLPDNAYERAGEGFFYRDKFGTEHTLLRITYSE